MRSLFKYLVIHPLIALLAILLVVLLLLGVLSATQTGTGLLVDLAGRTLPHLKLGPVSGTLLDRLTTDNLVWEEGGIRVEATGAKFNAGVGIGMPPRLNVQELSVDTLLIDLPPSEGPSDPIVMPDLNVPADVWLKNVALGELRIRQGTTDILLRDVKLDAHTRLGVLHLDELLGNLYSKDGTVKVKAKGEMGLAIPQPLSVDATATGDGTTFGMGDLKLSARGELQNYQLQLNGDWAYGDYPQYQLNARGRGNFEGMQFERLDLMGEAGDLYAEGRLDWSPALVWDLQLKGKGIKPETFAPDVPGVLDVVLSSKGRIDAGKPVMQLELSRLNGSLRDYPLDVTASAELNGEDIILHTLDAKVGENRLQAKGEAHDDLNIRWELDAPDLAQLHPDVKGMLQGKGALSGKLDGSEFALGVDSLTGKVLDYPLDAQGGLSLKNGLISAQDLRVEVDKNHIELNGVADEATGIDWKVDAKDLAQLHSSLSGSLKGDGNAQGLLDGSRFAVRINELTGQVLEYPLKASGSLQMKDKLLTAKALQVDVGKNHVELNGVADEATGIDWKINAKNLAQLHPSLSGFLKGNGNAQGLLDGSRFDLKINELAGQVLDYPVKASGEARMKDQLLTAKAVQLDVGKNHFELNGVADEATGIDWKVDAKNLAQLHPSLSGALKGNGKAQGLLDGSRFAVKINELTGQVLEYPLKASGSVQMKDQLLTAKAVQLDVGQNHFELDGVADEKTGINWKLDAVNLAQLHPALKGDLKGLGSVQGLLDGSRFALKISSLKGNMQGYPVMAAGEVRMKDEILSAKGLVLDVGDNHAELSGVVDEKIGVNWKIDAGNLTQLYPSLKGAIRGGGNAQGRLDGSRFAVKVDTLNGKIQGYPLIASGEVRMKNQVLAAKGLSVYLGDNHVELNGVADEATGLDWDIDAINLTQLHPSLKGDLKGSGNARGLLDGSRFAVKVKSLQGKVQGYPLMVSGEVSMRNQVLAAKGLSVMVGDNHVDLNGIADELTGLDWRVDAPRLAQLHPSLKGDLKGRGNARGLLDGSRFAVRVNSLQGNVQGYPLVATGEVSMKNQILAATGLSVSVGDNRVDLNGIADEATGIDWRVDARNLVQLHPSLKGDLKGAGNAQGLLDGSRFAVRINSLQGNVQGYPLLARGEVRMKDKLLSANGLSLMAGDNRIDLNGVADEATGLAWRLDAKNLAQLHPSLKGGIKGNGQARGLLDGSHLVLNVQQLQGRVQDYPLAASGDIEVKSKLVSARNVLVNVGQNRIRINGSAGDKLGLDWELDAKNIAQLYPDIRGSVQGNGSLSGKLDGSQLDLTVVRLNGQIEGRPLQASGKVNVQGKQISLRDVLVLAGENRLEANGRASEPFDLTWRVDARNLARAWPGLAGSLKGEGSLRGNLKQPQVQGNLQGSRLAYKDLKIATLDAQAKQNGGQYDIRGSLTNMQQGANVVNAADFSVQGQMARHTVTLALVSKDGKLDMRAGGGVQGESWNGAVQSLTLKGTVAGDWQLTNAMSVNASAAAVTVTNACLVNQQNARICAQQTSWTDKGGLVAKGALQQVPLAMARSFLPPGMQLPGLLTADYQFEQHGGKPSGRINLQLPDNVLTYQPAKGRPETLQYTNARASLILSDRVATLQAQLDIRDRGQFRVDGRINLSPEDQKHQVDVRATANLSDIGWLQAYSPQVDELKGQVNADVRVTGLLQKPQVTGAIRLTKGSLHLPETGARLEDINLTAQANNADQVSVAGSLRAGQGLLNANGVLRLNELPNWSADLRVQGNNLQLMNTHEIQAQVSPDLTIKATARKVTITGVVRIPETVISLRELPVGTNVRSDDIVIVRHGQKQGQPEKQVLARDAGAPIEILPDVMIELGERVTFNGFGLDARLAGKLRLLRNRQDVVAEGALNVVDGKYKAYGQSLRIERGRLLFNGPIENPGLDVRAVRDVEGGIKVGMSLSGSVQKPESTLFSSPQQTQTDTLSYLLTGHALSGVTGGETAILTQAITGLGVAGGESLAQNLGGKLGLDDVGLNTNGGDYRQSELSLGKRLGPRLYVKYIVGLFDSLQKIAVTYQINPRLQVEAASGVQQSVDLIYKLDTDTGPFGQ